MLRFRHLFKMADETLTKKLKTSSPLIGTHKSVFPWPSVPALSSPARFQ